MNHGMIILKTEIIKTLTLKEYVSAFLEKNLRCDQRSLTEKRPFIYNYNVLDLVHPSASGVMGNNKIIIVLKYKENSRKSGNNISFIKIKLDYVIDFSGESSYISEENLKSYINKLIRNNISSNDNIEFIFHIKVLNIDGNIIDCTANTLFNFFEDISKDLKLKEAKLNLSFHKKISSQTFCIVDDKVLYDPSNEEVSISTAYFTIIKFPNDKFLFFKINGGIVQTDSLKNLIKN